MGERLDPESVREVMARFFAVLRSTLERHGGTVEKFIGDAVMAVFGIPQAHEDDALRALRAAAEIRDGVRQLNDELEAEYGVTVSIRTGVNTGEVVAGDPGSGGTLVTGDTVNTAARLEQAAFPGEVLFGELTYALVHHAVTADPAGSFELKGKAKRVPAYRLLTVASEAPSRGRRHSVPMVGRSTDLAQLEEAFESAAETWTCKLVTVVGDPGIGKSRLLDEFLSRVESRGLVMRGRCLSYGQDITYWAIAEALRQGLGITDEDSPPISIHRIAEVLGALDEAEVMTRHIAAALGLSGDSVEPDDADWAIRRLLASLAAKSPVVLVLDDLHWAEPALLDLIRHIAESKERIPLLVICVARPELDPKNLGGWGPTVTIRLDALPQMETDTLIAALLSSTEVPTALLDTIAASAQGNPLFVEELLSMFIEGGLLRREDDRWLPTDHLTSFRIPPTINALLAGRLDQLSAEERAVLEPASIIGQDFPVAAVQELMAVGSRQAIDAAISSLLEKDLIRPTPDGLSGETLRFRHILIRDAAYEAIPKAERAALHERFADWLQGRGVTLRPEYDEIAGHHLEQSYRYRIELRPETTSDRLLAERAAVVLGGAGRRAFAGGDMNGATGLLSRSAGLLPKDDTRRWALLPDIATALTALGRYSEALTILDDVPTVAERDRVLDARWRLARFEVERQVNTQGWADQARAEIAGILDVLDEEGDEQALSHAYGVMAFTSEGGSLGQAERFLLLAADHARLVSDRRQETLWLSYAGTPSVYGPTTTVDAITRCQEILGLVRGSRSAEGNTLANLGLLWAMCGEFDRGRTLVAEGCQMLGDLGRMVDATGVRAERMGYVEMLAGDAEAAERELQPAIDFFERSGDRLFLASAEAELAGAVWKLGRIDQAYRLSQMSKRHAATDDQIAQSQWRMACALALASFGKEAEAERLARQAVAIMEGTDNVWIKAHHQEDLAEVLELAQDGEGAEKARIAALHMWEEKGNLVSAARLRASLNRDK